MPFNYRLFFSNLVNILVYESEPYLISQKALVKKPGLFLLTQKPYNFSMRLFKYVELKVEFEGISPPLSSPFSGTILRGAFGYNLRKILCIFKNRRTCNSCPVAENCLYYKIFETPAPENSPFKMDFLPHPFLISPITLNLNESKKLSFTFFLFGKYCQYSPYFIKVFENMALSGFGRNRSKPEFLRVYQGKREIFHLGSNEIKKPVENFYYLSKEEDASLVRINFLTPVKIKNKGRLTYPTEFEVFLRNIFRRVSIISFFFEGKKMNIDFKGLLNKAKEVKLLEWESSKVEIGRYSMRKKKKMELLGFTGKLVFQGPLSPFMPWLKTGEKFHIGKNTSFGFGKYKVNIEKK